MERKVANKAKGHIRPAGFSLKTPDIDELQIHEPIYVF